MNSDTVLKSEGLTILSERLGPVRAERFITLMIREAFDYTEWQRNLFNGVPLDDFLKNAMDSRQALRNGD